MANLEAFGNNVGVLHAYGSTIIANKYTEEEPLPTTIHTFSDVQKVLNAGKETEMLTVGMEMDEITINGEPMVWVIAAINHDSAYAHQVIFTPKWCLPTTRQMNTSDTNVGGWNSSALRAWLNGDFYTGLPSSVKPYIKDRTFQTSQGNTSTALQSATDKIWLPREYEIFGATNYAAATEHTTGGAEQFSIFAVATNRIKTIGRGGSAHVWWETSPYTGNAAGFCGVNNAGAAAYYSGTSDPFGVLPCFHMLPDPTPSTDTIEITENGSYDVTQYSVADVQVGGGQSSMVLIGNYSSLNAYTVDVKSQINNYASKTKDDFYIKDLSFSGAITGSNQNDMVNGNPIVSYDANSGTLTLGKAKLEYWINSAYQPKAYFTYNIYCFD